MKTLLLAVATLALLAAAPSATADCPAEPPSPPMFPSCTDSPALVSLGECVSYGLGWAHANQVWIGEIVQCA